MIQQVESTLAAGDEPAPRTRLMVVEDESVVAMDLCDQLESMGYEVCATADNAIDALRLAREQRPDLVLMDIIIRGNTDGIETAREMASFHPAPVIFLTAFNDNATVERAAQAGPFGYITKPYQVREVRAVIEVALAKAQFEQQLRASHRWYAATLRAVADAVIATDREACVRLANPAAEALLGFDHNEIAGQPLAALIGIGEHVDADGEEGEPGVVHFDRLTVRRSGTEIPVEGTLSPIVGERGERLGSVLAFRDLRRRHAMERQLRASEERFRNAFADAPLGMALVDMDGRFLQVNGAMASLLKTTCQDLEGQSLWSYSLPDEVDAEREQLQQLRDGTLATLRIDKRFRTGDDSEIWTITSASILTQGGESLGFLYQVHDVSERKDAEAQLERLAHTDTLTGLANRARLWQQAEQMLEKVRQRESQMGVLFIDLDQFKQINDSMGHDVGDMLLQTVARRLRSTVRESDCVARLGGDEFVVVLPHLRGQDDMVRIAEKIMQQFTLPLVLEGKPVRVGASIGVALYPSDGDDVRTLLKCADSALYHAKSLGRGTVQFYRHELTEQVERRLQLDMELRTALEENQFELAFQPIVPIGDIDEVAVETLLRWRHPQRGLLSPAHFIQHAEESGLIIAIGDWVIEQACRAAATWPRVDGRRVAVAVNVSANQFRAGNLLQVVRSALSSAGLDPSLLYLEITEQLMLQDSEQTMDTIVALKTLGVRIALDDFGVGYSSLSYVTRFAPDQVKIDRSFIDGVTHRHDSAAIVRAVLAMCRSLGISVVAEGVETAAQLNFLANERCALAQGYLFSRPIDAVAIQAWLRESAADAGGRRRHG